VERTEQETLQQLREGDGSRRPSGGVHYGWVILGVGILATFGALGLARFGYTPVLPRMQEGLGLDNTGAGFLASANLTGYALLALIGGALASRFGPRAVIASGLLIGGVGMLLTALAQGFASAALARTLTGMGSGLSNVPVMGLMAAWFASRRRGLASGIVVTGISLALVTVGLFVPRFLEATGDDGWRWTWVIYGSATLVLGIVAALALRNHPSEKGLRPVGEDAPAPPATPAAEPEKRSPGGRLGGGLAWGRVYRSAPVYHLAAVYTAFGFSYLIYLTFFTKYLISEGGYEPTGAGDMLMVLGWASIFCGILWGTVSDLIGRRASLIIVYLIQATSFALFALWDSAAGFTISAILFGLTAWSIPAIMAATCGDVLGPRLAPAALGYVTLFFAIGQAFGPPIAGRIADQTGSFGPAFLLAAGVAVLGAVLAAFLRPAATQELITRRVVGEA
jgi:MFS family permease